MKNTDIAGIYGKLVNLYGYLDTLERVKVFYYQRNEKDFKRFENKIAIQKRKIERLEKKVLAHINSKSK